MIPTTSELYDLSHTLAAPLLSASRYPWEVLGGIQDFVLKLGETLPVEEYDHPSETVWIAKGVIFRRLAVGGPAGLADAAVALERNPAVGLLVEDL